MTAYLLKEDVNAVRGADGAPGATGATGETGESGSASSWVATISIVALAIAGFVLYRRMKDKDHIAQQLRKDRDKRMRSIEMSQHRGGDEFLVPHSTDIRL